MSKIAACVTLAGIVLSLAPLTAGADTTSMGTLVYNFSYSAQQKVTARDSANPVENTDPNGTLAAGTTNNGMSHYAGELNDKGTMTVDVVRQQPDGALVVMISEQGENIRRAPAAECVVYGNTNVICDPNKTVYTEEYTLLRFLGGNFVDPNALDAQRHWQVVQNTPTLAVKADYTITSNTNGVMQIGETRSLRSPKGGSLTTDIQSKIGYDFKRSVPMMVDEYVTQRHDDGVVGTSTTIYQTTLNLVSDTMAKT
ncbi:MAG TPA: hypothetical protein VMT95_06505 [Candidatus Binatia bacterium]|nr:hypothetical protein [Candidatus Binatia bacterium]